MKRFTRKSKKHKKYSTNYLLLLLKFLVFITILEGYFLYQYFQSDNFLGVSLRMINEAATISERNFANFFLYQSLFEMIATNSTASVYNIKEPSYLSNYISTFNSDLESFLKVHSDNVGKHDKTFNNFFNGLVYQSVCDSINS